MERQPRGESTRPKAERRRIELGVAGRRPAGLLGAVAEYLTEEGWPFRAFDDAAMLTLGFQGASASWRCVASVDEERRWFAFYSVLPVTIPAEQRALAAEYLTRANGRLVLGNFELDFADGEVRFKTSIDVEGGELTRGMIEGMIHANVLAVDRYYPGLLAVLAGQCPAAAVAAIDGEDCAGPGEDDEPTAAPPPPGRTAPKPSRPRAT